MNRMLFAFILALSFVITACGNGNLVGPSSDDAVPALKDGKAAHLLPPTKLDHWYDGEPYRGTDPELGPR